MFLEEGQLSIERRLVMRSARINVKVPYKNEVETKKGGQFSARR